MLWSSPSLSIGIQVAQRCRLAVDDESYAGNPVQRVAADLRLAAAYAIFDTVTILGLVLDGGEVCCGAISMLSPTRQFGFGKATIECQDGGVPGGTESPRLLSEAALPSAEHGMGPIAPRTPINALSQNSSFSQRTSIF